MYNAIVNCRRGLKTKYDREALRRVSKMLFKNSCYLKFARMWENIYWLTLYPICGSRPSHLSKSLKLSKTKICSTLSVLILTLMSSRITQYYHRGELCCYLVNPRFPHHGKSYSDFLNRCELYFLYQLVCEPNQIVNPPGSYFRPLLTLLSVREPVETASF